MSTTLAERASAIALYARNSRESERIRNRLTMPETARILDELRAVFGKPAYFKFEEAGRIVEYGERL